MWFDFQKQKPPEKVLVETYIPNPYPLTEWDISGSLEQFAIELEKENRHYFNNWVENGVWASCGYGKVSHWRFLTKP